MRRLLALALVAAMTSLGLPGVSSAARLQAPVTTGQLSGTARNQAGVPITDATVRLRNTGTGQVAGVTKTAADGGYEFTNVPAGSYVVELLDSNGGVAATSMSVSLGTGSMNVSGVALTASSGKAGVGAVASAGAGHFFKSTAGILLLAAAGGVAVAGIVGASTDKSPSR
jgi:hypothetical protein